MKNLAALPFTLALCFAGAPLPGLAADPATPVVPASVATAASQVAQLARSGTIKQVEGAVSGVDAQGGRRSLKPGDAVTVADQVVTGPNSAASLVLRDGSTLMLGPDSQLEIKGFTYDAARQEGNVFLAMLRGTMRMITGLIGKAHPEAVKIHTPTAVIGVLGTDFIVQAQGKP